MQTKQIIIVRKDLNMRKGKMITQGAHASLKAILNLMQKYKDDKNNQNLYQLSFGDDCILENWLNGDFKKITLGVNSLEELKEIYEKAKEKEIPCALIEDLGLTEFNEPTITALSIGPYISEELDKITGNLKLL